MALLYLKSIYKIVLSFIYKDGNRTATVDYEKLDSTEKGNRHNVNFTAEAISASPIFNSSY